jgi:hypothetical protein
MRIKPKAGNEIKIDRASIEALRCSPSWDPEKAYAQAQEYVREQRRKAERPAYEGGLCGNVGRDHAAGGIPSATASGARGAGGAR